MEDPYHFVALCLCSSENIRCIAPQAYSVLCRPIMCYYYTKLAIFVTFYGAKVLIHQVQMEHPCHFVALCPYSSENIRCTLTHHG